MATENGHDHADSKISMPDGNLAGFDTLDALFQVIQSHIIARPSEVRAANCDFAVQHVRSVTSSCVSALSPPPPSSHLDLTQSQSAGVHSRGQAQGSAAGAVRRQLRAGAGASRCGEAGRCHSRIGRLRPPAVCLQRSLGAAAAAAGRAHRTHTAQHRGSDDRAVRGAAAGEDMPESPCWA